MSRIIQKVWLDNLPSDRTQLGENYDRLRLLTKDLTEIYHQGQSGYPQFDSIVVSTDENSKGFSLTTSFTIKTTADIRLSIELVRSLSSGHSILKVIER
jgi:hypothetical protein